MSHSLCWPSLVTLLVFHAWCKLRIFFIIQISVLFGFLCATHEKKYSIVEVNLHCLNLIHSRFHQEYNFDLLQYFQFIYKD